MQERPGEIMSRRINATEFAVRLLIMLPMTILAIILGAAFQWEEFQGKEGKELWENFYDDFWRSYNIYPEDAR